MYLDHRRRSPRSSGGTLRVVARVLGIIVGAGVLWFVFWYFYLTLVPPDTSGFVRILHGVVGIRE
jgi:hypothetical protein